MEQLVNDAFGSYMEWLREIFDYIDNYKLPFDVTFDTLFDVSFYVIVLLCCAYLCIVALFYHDFSTRYNRTLSAWLSLFWVFFIAWDVISALGNILNELLAFMGVLVFFRYDRTRMYFLCKRIFEFSV